MGQPVHHTCTTLLSQLYSNNVCTNVRECGWLHESKPNHTDVSPRMLDDLIHLQLDSRHRATFPAAAYVHPPISHANRLCHIATFVISPILSYRPLPAHASASCKARQDHLTSASLRSALVPAACFKWNALSQIFPIFHIASQPGPPPKRVVSAPGAAALTLPQPFVSCCTPCAVRFHSYGYQLLVRPVSALALPFPPPTPPTRKDQRACRK